MALSALRSTCRGLAKIGGGSCGTGACGACCCGKIGACAPSPAAGACPAGIDVPSPPGAAAKRPPCPCGRMDIGAPAVACGAFWGGGAGRPWSNHAASLPRRATRPLSTSPPALLYCRKMFRALSQSPALTASPNPDCDQPGPALNVSDVSAALTPGGRFGAKESTCAAALAISSLNRCS